MATIYIKVMFAKAAYDFTTSFNGTFEQARAYYIGNQFNMGIRTDLMALCIDIELLA